MNINKQTVYFIFQPAEEGRAGAKQMLDEGLFKLFPTDSIYGLHNFPDIPAGHFAIKLGPIMASFDCFEITFSGQATHAAMPHMGNDVMVAGAQLITALQTIISRNINPTNAAVLSITQVHAGNTWNAIPDSLVLRGTYRCFDDTTQALIQDRLEQLVAATAQAFNLKFAMTINPENPGYPVTNNSDTETTIATEVAQALVGVNKVDLAPTPSMDSEDSAFMLQEKPGCYAWLGNGTSDGNCLLHNPHYDFNDQILTVGANYWVNLVEHILR